MCGIAGFSGNFNRELLIRMNEKISHRGPDGEGILFDQGAGVGLAHKRLSIIDINNGIQPMWDLTKRFAITFNGEIYNYKTLMKSLFKKGYRFKTISDTEVLITLYIEYGEKMFEYINGIFAFALWDTNDDTLILARDGVGVKPLYYTETDLGFIFSSEMKAILCENSLKKELCIPAVYSYLTCLWSASPTTILECVKKLEPGHFIKVREGHIEEKKCFYELPYDQPIQDYSQEEAIKEVQVKLRTAVERQMVSDVEVGAFLSGGLDSSTLIAFAKEHLKDRRLQCFTIDYQDNCSIDGRVDDLPYARKVAKYLDVDLHTISVGPDMFKYLEKMIYHMDEPVADPAALNTFYICQLARENGIKVLLSGTGGDDIFTGYRRHYALMQEKYWTWLPLIFRNGIEHLSSKLPNNNPYTRRIRKAFQYASNTQNERISSYFFWQRPSIIYNMLTKSVQMKVSERYPYMSIFKSLKNVNDVPEILNKMLYLEGKHFLADQNLIYTDKMSMANGVEVRVPFLDRDVISLAARLPVKLKQKGIHGKWILKKSTETILPKDIIYRPKTGFGVPLRAWMNNHLTDMIDDTLSESSLKRRGIFDFRRIKKLRTETERFDGAYSLFAVMCLEIWCRQYLDN